MFSRKFFLFLFAYGFSLITCSAQGIWVQKANVFSSGRAGVVGFSIGSKGYFGTGWQYTNNNLYNDFWEWDQTTNVWTQKANFPGTSRGDASGFSIGTKGYIGTGTDGLNYYADFWEWDQALNTWTQKANSTTSGKGFGIGFSIGTKGYFGTGGPGAFNDFWQWDQATNVWTQQANFGGGNRANAVGFSMNNKGYIGTGKNLNTFYNDFWEYDPTANIWTQKANFPGGIRGYASCFSIGTKGYIGTGADASGNVYDDFYEWDQTTNTWTQEANYPHQTSDIDHASFSIGCYGYFGCGSNNPTSATTYYNDFWEYEPAGSGIVVVSLTATASTVCAGQAVTITAGGGNNYSWNTGSTVDPIIVSPSATTTYSVIASNACASDTTSITITVNPAPTVVVSGINSLCAGDNVTLTAIGTGGGTYSWSSGATTTSITVSPAASTTYSVILSNGMCNDAANFSVTVLPKGTASFIYEYEACKSNCVQFTDQSVNASNWCWSLGDGGNSSSQNPCWIYPASATYNPSLIINCNTACADTFSASLLYNVLDTASVLYIPNAFSPNSDGENDFLKFYLPDNYCLKEFEITIYDRWGEKVFETKDMNGSWDGALNGKKLNSGVFVYYCKSTSATGRETIRKGNISLVR